MSKIIKIVAGLVVVVAVAGVGIKAIQKAKAKEEHMATSKIYPLVVKSFKPKLSDVKLTLPYLAEVGNDKDVVLSSNISSRIISIVKSGEKVKKGEVIAKLDTTNILSNQASIKDQLSASTLNLENLKRTHQRTIELLKVQGASIEQSQKEENQIASNMAQIASLKQKLIELKNNLSYAIIKSPVDGIVAKTFSRRGSIAMPGKHLVSISSQNGFYLLARVPRDTKIKGVIFEGVLYDTTALASTFHGLLEYKVYINNHSLTSGDRVEIDVVTYNDKGLLLPFDAVLNREGKSYVLVVEKNKATAFRVDILQSAEQGLLVVQDLKDKTIVLAKPDILLKLVSGYALKVKE